MILELHDTAPNSLAARVPDIGNDDRAEYWIALTHREAKAIMTVPGRWVVRWELHDDLGLRAVWERPAGSRELPKLTRCASRFTGQRPVNPKPGSIP